MGHESGQLGIEAIISGLGQRLVEARTSLLRVSVSLSDFHPEVIGRSYNWHRLKGASTDYREYTLKRSDAFTKSPVRLIQEGAEAVRRRLDGPNAQLDFPIAHELAADGATDYAAMALKFSNGTRQFISWAGDGPEGFSSEELALFDTLLPFISLRLEVEHGRHVTDQVLGIYLGDNAAKKVLSGAVRRHEGEDMEAVIFYCDLRGFTRLTEALPAADVIQTLSVYYDAVGGPVRARGGDILKMIGDGMLAVFPIGRGMDCARAAQEAAEAAKEARHALAALTPADLPEGAHPLAAGFALHVGTVTFGNVGSRDRLDFTVIGPAVNEVARVEAMTKILGRSILLSADFTKAANGLETKSLGFHALRGIRDPRELFTLA